MNRIPWNPHRNNLWPLSGHHRGSVLPLCSSGCVCTTWLCSEDVPVPAPRCRPPEPSARSGPRADPQRRFQTSGQRRPKIVPPFAASREGKRRGLLWKTLAGVSVGVPAAAGLQYAASSPRERRKMRIVVEGFGRLFRFVLRALILTLKPPLAFIPRSPEHIPSQPTPHRPVGASSGLSRWEYSSLWITGGPPTWLFVA